MNLLYDAPAYNLLYVSRRLPYPSTNKSRKPLHQSTMEYTHITVVSAYQHFRPKYRKILKGRKNHFQIINCEGYLKVCDEFNCHLPGKRY